MKLVVPAGATSQIWQLYFQNFNDSTGGGLKSLASNTATFSVFYHRDADPVGSAVSVVLADMTIGTFTSGGFKEIHSTNLQGVYQFCPPNLALATGAKSCVFLFSGVTASLAPLPIEVELIGADIYSTSPDVNLKTIAGSTVDTTSAQLGVRLNNFAGSTVSSTSGIGTTSNLKKNATSAITFVMTDATTHAPKTGCTITSQKSLDGGALSGTINSATEIGSGMYVLNLAASDTNANELAYRFTASGADDLVIERVTQP